MKCERCHQPTTRTISIDGQQVCEECEIDLKPERYSHTCVECGARTAKKHSEEFTQSVLVAFDLCFMCNFWAERIDGGVIVEDEWGRWRYTIGEEPTDRRQPFLGHGGSRFDIQFLDGRQVVTHNLWHQGTIPEHFLDRFPVNAKFGFDEPSHATLPEEFWSGVRGEDWTDPSGELAPTPWLGDHHREPFEDQFYDSLVSSDEPTTIDKATS